jgi:glycosyltransferase involved in cell wall biosynthesis
MGQFLMRVLVYEPWFAGHSVHYLRHLLPRLAEEAREVVVATTSVALASEEFATSLKPMADRITFDDCVPNSHTFLNNLNEAVRRVRPDYVLVPTADVFTRPMSLQWLQGKGGLPGNVPSEAIIHGGGRWETTSLKRRSKLLINRLLLRLSCWKKIHNVDVLLYEDLRAGLGSLGRRVALLPHPVAPSPRLEKQDARRRLGIPEDGRYIGLLAVFNRNKAIPQLLAAFRAATARPDDRLLLAGRMREELAALIRREYDDLVARGRIVLMNRFIEPELSDAVFCALDVVCTPYPGFPSLSAVLLQGVAAGRPVLANDYGWSRSMIGRFGFGTTCDVLDPKDFTSAIGTALDRSGEYQETEATRRLLAFHDPANFAEGLTGGLRAAMGRPPTGRARTWDWVVEAIDEERRSRI